MELLGLVDALRKRALLPEDDEAQARAPQEYSFPCAGPGETGGAAEACGLESAVEGCGG